MDSVGRVRYLVAVALLVLVTGCGFVVASSLGASGLTTQSRTVTVEASPVSGQYELTEQDSGKSFVYTVTSRFSVILDGTRYAPPAIRCTPEGIIGTITNLPSVAPPLAVRRFEGVRAGRCTLRTGEWHVMIEIVGGQ